ncbi:MAG TPA: STAS domain-containing protein [Mycobacterium sp.]|nr:STAS domain-containing protein [Micromonosporaceae bacterium]
MRIVFSSSRTQTPAIMKLSGELDLSGERIVENAISAVWWLAGDLILDLSGLEFCSCGGLTVFLRVARRYRNNGGQLSLAAPRGIVRRLIEVAGIDELMPVYATVAGAITHDRGDRIG